MGYSWTIHQYIHKNDGSGDVSHYSNSGTASVPQGSGYSANITVHSNPYTRDGYDFLGYTRGSGGTTLYQPGEGYTVSFSAGNGSKDLNWYCKWAIKKYAVSFNGNGGTNVPAAQTKTHGVILALSGTRPVKSGYRFVEWNTKADGTGTSYQPGGTYTGNAALTLYAIWELLTYTISFNANGGVNAPQAEIKTHGADLTLPSSEPTREGYSFAGWATSDDAAVAAYQPGGTYTGNGNATLYAVWNVVISTHTLTYDANGGLNAPTPQSQTYSIEDQRSFTVTSEQPTRDGYAFRGWSNTANGAVDYSPGDTITAAEDKTIYAVWEKTRFTITYDANGGTNAPTAQMKDKDVPIAITTAVPEKQADAVW